MDVESYWKKYGLAGKSHVDKIVYLAMFCHIYRDMDRVITGDIRRLFEELHLTPPNVSYYLKILSEGKNKRFIRDRRGFRVEGRARRSIEEEIAGDEEIVLNPAVASLSEKFKDGDELKFFEEALASYSSRSFRSFIVMLWCLVIAHIVNGILADHKKLAAFNGAFKAHYPKKGDLLNFDDFMLIKEFEIIEFCQQAKILSKNVATVAKEKLRRRNMAAHPSPITFTQLQVDDFATDVVNNIINKV